MKQYVGSRNPNGSLKVVVIRDGADQYQLHHVVLHSPTGMECGYAGSGPADTALSILADYFGEKPSKKQLHYGRCKCVRLHQQFKFRFIATADRNGFYIQSNDIAEWMKGQTEKLEAI